MTSLRARLGTRRRQLRTLSAVMTALAVAAPVSDATAAIFPGGVAQGGQANGPAGCVDANQPSGVGDAGAVANQVCGVTLAFVGPSTGQIATAVGPTIIGSTVLAPITVSPAPVAVEWLP
jgi:hypothetical protein